jgi:hypothetical protein
MRDENKNSYSMTLRLPPAIATDLENTAYDLKLSKSGFIRRSILRALIQAKEHQSHLPANPTLRRALQKWTESDQ